MKAFAAVFFFTVSYIQLMSQGCSDAGFCTMGAMRPNQHYAKKLNFRLRTIEYNFYHGKTNLSPVINAHQIDLNASLGAKNTIQLKVPYMFISGNLGENQGIGDISYSFTRLLTSFKDWHISGTLGGKIPVNDGNQTISNSNSVGQVVSLPMYYQTSLGSWDVVGGASIINGKWLFATGFQHAFTANENQFQWSDWGGYGDQNYIQKHDVGRELKRGTDVMLRAERSFRFINFDAGFGLLSIWRLTQDKVYIPATDSWVKLNGTTGMALTALGSFGYQVNVRNAVRLMGGLKITDRDVNPDGLTRKHVISISLIHRF